MSIAFDQIGEYYSINLEGKNFPLAVTMLPLGAMLGAFISGPLSYRGRRKSIIYANIILISGIITLFIPNYFLFLFIGRFLIGVAVGIFTTIIPIFIVEISPIHKKGQNGTACQFSITFGVCTSYSIGLLISHNQSKDLTVIIFIFQLCCSLFQVCMLLFVFTYETPKFYIIKSDYEKANILMSKLKPYPKSNHRDSESTEFLFIAEEYDWNKDGRKFSSLSKPKYKRAFIVGIIISACHQLTGIDLIILYLSKVSPFSEDENELTFLIVVIEAFLTSILLVWLMKKMGKKQLMLIGELLLCGCNCLLFQVIDDLNEENNSNSYRLCVKYITIMLFFVFLFSYTISIGPICWIFLAEIMTEIGMGIAILANWAIIFCISLYPYFAPKISNESQQVSYSAEFFIFCGSCILGFFLIATLVKETKNMTPFEIMKLYCEFDYNALTEVKT